MAAFSSRCWAGAVFLALVLLSSAAPAAKAISCIQALEYLMPCQSYLMGFGEISSACCLGAEALAQASAAQADRRTVCHCLKQVALSTNIGLKKAEQIPQLCKISLPFAIQPDINCDAIPIGDQNMPATSGLPPTPGVLQIFM